jgi:hypothetical protein
MVSEQANNFLLGGTFTTTLGVLGSSIDERDLGGAEPPVNILAICFILAMFTNLSLLNLPVDFHGGHNLRNEPGMMCVI